MLHKKERNNMSTSREPTPVPIRRRRPEDGPPDIIALDIIIADFENDGELDTHDPSLSLVISPAVQVYCEWVGIRGNEVGIARVHRPKGGFEHPDFVVLYRKKTGCTPAQAIAALIASAWATQSQLEYLSRIQHARSCFSLSGVDWESGEPLWNKWTVTAKQKEDFELTYACCGVVLTPIKLDAHYLGDKHFSRYY